MPPPLVRYAAVGAVATAVHYAVLTGLVEGWAVRPGPAAAIGAWIGAQVAFAGNARYTFNGAFDDAADGAQGLPLTRGASSRRSAIASAWIRFQVTAAIGALISFGVVAAGVRLGVYYLAAQVVATLVAMFVTYEVNRRWSFARPTPPRA